jgi:serine/threonine protein kinase
VSDEKPSDAEVLSVITARFAIRQVLHTGPHSLVLMVQDAGRMVVMKVLRPGVDATLQERFRRELRLLRQLDHPGIVKILDDGIFQNGTIYYTMDHDAGSVTLGERLRGASGPPDRGSVLALFASLSSGLDHMHRAGIVHRDIKPSNILVAPDGRGVWLDLGLALAPAEAALTQAGALIGTLLYVSPEMARAETVGAPSDLFQLGLVLYHLLAGAPHATDPRRYYRRLTEGRSVLEHLDALCVPLQAVLRRATDERPAFRFATAGEMYEQLRKITPEIWGTRPAAEPRTEAVGGGELPEDSTRWVPERYQVRGKLGRGGEGMVFRCYDTVLKREVALKFPFLDEEEPDDTGRERFLQQATLLFKVRHPNVARVFDLGLEHEPPYIVFEYKTGVSLAQRLKDSGPFSPRLVTDIAQQVASGLENLHANGIFHRDIKPGNLVLAGRLLSIIDLGAARDLNSVTRLTRTGEVPGTPLYMAPEVLVSGDGDAAADFYSLGITLCQCLTGRLPFVANLNEMLCAKVNGRLELPPIQLSGRPLRRLIEALVAVEPAARPRTAAQVRALLDREGPAASPALWVNRKRGLAVLVLLALCLWIGRGLWQTAGVALRFGACEAYLDGLHVVVLADGPWPVELTWSVPAGGKYTLVSQETATRHEFDLPVPPGQDRVTLEATGARVKPVRLSARFRPRVAEGRWDGDYFQVKLRTRKPSRCRLRHHRAIGLEPTAWSPSGTEHAFGLPRSRLPFLPRFIAEVQGKGTVDVSLDDLAQANFLTGVVPWFETKERARVGVRLLENPRFDQNVVPDAYGDVVRQIDALSREALPAWFLSEIGGAGGVLGHSGIAPGVKDRFYKAVWMLEAEQEARELVQLRRSEDFRRLYGPDFGPTTKARYPGGRVIPIRTEPYDGRTSFEVVTRRPTYPPDDAPNPPPGMTAQLRGRFTLKERPARVELHARLRLVPGRLLRVVLNQERELRLIRPVVPFPARAPADVYFAFDPAYLKVGLNTLVCDVPRFPAAVMVSAFEAGAQVAPPGLSLVVLPAH